jgi:integrase
LRRERGVKKTPKEALKRDLLLDVLPPPPADNQPKAKRLAAARNRAIMLLAFSGAFRRSEVASLNVDDVEYDEVGVAVTLTRSKTNQEGLLETVLIPFAETKTSTQRARSQRGSNSPASRKALYFAPSIATAIFADGSNLRW